VFFSHFNLQKNLSPLTGIITDQHGSG